MARNRQQEIIDYILQYREQHGQGPTLAEIAEGVGFKSKSTVQSCLQRMERKGLITWTRGEPRSIEVLAGAKGKDAAPAAGHDRTDEVRPGDPPPGLPGPGCGVPAVGDEGEDCVHEPRGCPRSMRHRPWQTLLRVNLKSGKLVDRMTTVLPWWDRCGW